MDTHTVYISLGSNSGNREGMLLEAYSRISEKVAIPDNRSSIYETAAWGNKDQPAFLNAVLSVQTKIKPDALLGKLLGIEKEMGRKRGPLRWTERCIDLDILFYDLLSIQSKNLSIPHPEISNRRFVLVPLDEIAPEYTHPNFGKSMHDLLEGCRDELPVTRLTGPDWRQTDRF